MAVIDAKNLVLGRLAAVVAERLLNGENITIVNAEGAVVSGNRKYTLEKFKTNLDIRAKGDPHKGPKYSKMPDRAVRRTIRGMLPFKKPRGKSAFKRLKVYCSVPEELRNAEMETVKGAENRLKVRFTSVGEISKAFGVKAR